ncbi:hypothetical protein J6590_095002 [Homalodisca vitripennis]|nr:hypothetical protein J6590_095002 [Homalodisca vitripennis]
MHAANLRWERFKQTCRNRSVVGAGRETTFCYHSELRSERVKLGLANLPRYNSLFVSRICNGIVGFKYGAISTKSRRIYRLLWFSVDHIERGSFASIKPPVALECREAARSRGRYRPGWLEGYLLFAERAAVAKRKSAQNNSRTGPFKISGGVALIGTADD